ncbi:oligosaccharyl transferase delta subunit [Pseudozyma hubeiensis SY62]|uniref:Oligosaccharyl transferase delta subunit n=1 Tax=Pseudozyma hubeiensis (strain SY62) TaxID=1305764 RepID=R9PA69_PSEHS|nr:oligosaccharyl transferase delta subunit [Pseudozyma hubeiensis SY62]GAC98268.1 oligosaccharyl transferase delta subunit [Pseudozyma hubeiensis SY62]
MRSIAVAFAAVFLSLLVVLRANAALSEPKLRYVLNSGKLALSTVDGSSRLSKEFSTHADYSKNTSPFSLAAPTQLENDDVIRLGFSLSVEEATGKKVAKDGSALGKEHVPHQAFIVLASEQDESASHAWPVAVKPSTGKVTWNLRMDRIPASLLRAPSPLTLSILIANFPTNSAPEGAYSPLSLPLLSLIPPSSLVDAAIASASSSLSAREKAEIEQGFHGLPEHKHTFGIPPTETMPSTKISGLASLITAAVPWLFLIAALGVIKPEIQSPSSKALVLFAALAGLEALAVRYWIGLTLFQMLPLLLGAGLVTVVVGRSALVELRKKRLAVSS